MFTMACVTRSIAMVELRAAVCRENTLADSKRAIHAGDEWANIYQFNIAVSFEPNRDPYF